MTLLTCAVVICTRNRIESLVTCLKSISVQTYSIAQLIIVDSSDQPLNSLSKFVDVFNRKNFSSTNLVYLHTRPGLTFQRNRGVACAEADVVFFFDDDVVLPPQYIAYLMETFQANPDYGGGMGTIANIHSGLERPSDYLRRFFLLTHSGGDGRMQRSGLPAHSHGKLDFMEVEVLSGAAAYRSRVFDDFTFDENLTGYAYMEDVDFSYRVSRRYKLFYDPRAVLEHHHSPLARDKITANRRMFLVNHNYLFFKNIYPNCRWCILYYIWSILGLFLLALLGRHWEALFGYGQGVYTVLLNRLRGRCVLSSE